MAMTAAERQRRCREKRKNDAAKIAEVKKKDLERYHARKTLVKDMDDREHRSAKRKWRKANKKRREKLKALQRILQNTPPTSPIPFLPPQVNQNARKKVRRDRTRLYRQNLKLQEQLKNMKTKYEKYKKRYHRIEEKIKEEKKRQKYVNKDNKYNVLTSAIRDRYQKIKNIRKKRYLQAIFEEKIIKQSRSMQQIIKDSLGLQHGTLRSRIPAVGKQTLLIKKIQDFFLRDDVSRATAGKKETVTMKKQKMQKRVLLDSMKKLHKSFLKENPDLVCHYSYFTKHKPFFVKYPSIDGRDTCLCKLHANTVYILIALHKNKIVNTNDLSQVICETTCNSNSMPCMNGTCVLCQCKTVKYDMTNKDKLVELQQWVRKTDIVPKDGKRVRVCKNVKETQHITVYELSKKFDAELSKIKTHIYNIKIQYRAYRKCIDELTDSEIILHIDFSENYACKYHEEIQSHHFGGSRNQVSLHTVVLYKYSPDQENRVKTFCTVSPSNNHGPAAIWAHLFPILEDVTINMPAVKTVHFFSDGPTTQYRQKLNFYLLSTRVFEYGFERVTWNFFEAGHGKGAADGVGGFLKRQADNAIACGQDISDASSFFSTLEGISRIKLFLVLENDILLVADTIPKNIKALPGTMQVHQVFSENYGKLKYRKLSCFCNRGFCECYQPGVYQALIEPDAASDVSSVGPLADITNLTSPSRPQVYGTIYSSSSSESSENLPLSAFTNQQMTDTVPCTSNSYLNCVDEIHPSKISDGVHILVKILDEKKGVSYTYLGTAMSNVDEEGDVKVMFYRSVDDSGRKFKLIQNDLSYVKYEDILKIVPNPNINTKRRRVVVYEFETPLDVFEK